MTSDLSLRERQRWFAATTTHPGGVVAGAAHASASLGRAIPLELWVTEGPSLTAAERLGIYAGGYSARLVECLTDDYPALAHLLGEEAFVSLCRDYVEKYPSRSPSLNAFGRNMTALCRTRREPWAPFAADLARLEWTLVEIVHAPTASSLDPNALAAVPAARWNTARLVPSPTFRLLTFDYPVNRYFQSFLDGDEPCEHPARSESATAVFRQGLTLWRMDLEPTAARLLEDLVSGSPLDSALNELSRRTNDAGEVLQRLPGWLGAWVANGFFCALE
jgi:hypothetical protein